MRIALADLKNKIKNIDLFICSAGFESRSTIVAKYIELNDIKYKTVFHISNTYQISNDNLEKIKSFGSFNIIEYPKNEPIQTYDIIKDYLNSINEDINFNVLIDVTTFTREVLLILLKAFDEQKIKEKFTINFIYTPAGAYEISDNIDEQWLTKGVREIRSIFGYSGLHTPSKKLMLIVLSGIEDERVETIIENFEPTALLLGKPDKNSTNHPLLDKKSDVTNERFKNKYPSYLGDFEFSCSNIGDTKEAITSICKKYEDEYNITIAPLNNKLSTLGVALACLEKENIQICYASANQYNISTYSKPSEFCIYCGKS